MDYSDLTYLAVVPSIYSILEPTLAITLACVPMLRPLFGGKYSNRGTLLKRKPWKSHTTTIRPENTAGGLGSNKKHSSGRFQRMSDNKGTGNNSILDGDDGDYSSVIELRPAGNAYQDQVSTQSNTIEHTYKDGGEKVV